VSVVLEAATVGGHEKRQCNCVAVGAHGPAAAQCSSSRTQLAKPLQPSLTQTPRARRFLLPERQTHARMHARHGRQAGRRPTAHTPYVRTSRARCACRTELQAILRASPHPRPTHPPCRAPSRRGPAIEPCNRLRSGATGGCSIAALRPRVDRHARPVFVSRRARNGGAFAIIGSPNGAGDAARRSRAPRAGRSGRPDCARIRRRDGRRRTWYAVKWCAGGSCHAPTAESTNAPAARASSPV
jgi:hypothetical protein